MRLIITHFIASTLFIWAAIMLIVCFNCLADLPATITYVNVGYGLRNSYSRETLSCRSSIYTQYTSYVSYETYYKFVTAGYLCYALFYTGSFILATVVDFCIK